MSNYFIHTSSVEMAINVMACRTTALGVRFGKRGDMWEQEFHIDKMKEELHIGSYDYVTVEHARNYIYSQVDDKYLPEVVKKVRKLKEDADDILYKHNKIMNQIMDNINIKKSKLIRFAKEYYDLETDGLTIAQIVEKLRNV